MKKLAKILLVLGTILFLIAGWTAFRIIQTGQRDAAANADAIVVLGAAEYAGKPSPVFQARLDHGRELFEQNLAPLIITTGGTHPGENISEGEAGKRYLEGLGVPSQAIIADTQSLTTKQNLSRVKEIAGEKNIHTVILVSDPFHLYRSARIAQDLGFTALPSPALKSPISENAWLEVKYIVREVMLVLLHEFFDV